MTPPARPPPAAAPSASGDPRLHLAVIQPEIPQNTGNLGRLCLGVGATLHLVHPLGFRTDQKAVRRAGIDHWQHVDVQEHQGLLAFSRWLRGRRWWSFSRHGGRPYSQVPFRHGDVLVLGRESVGLPDWWLELAGAYAIPLPGRGRSLNLANAAAVLIYAALAEIEPALFPAPEGHRPAVTEPLPAAGARPPS